MSCVDSHLICSFLNTGADVTYKPMPCGNPLFTGRGDYLEKLCAYFSPRADSRPRRLFLLYGVGGIGKTQISLKFAEENASQSVSNPLYIVGGMLSYGHSRFWRIFWVDATSAETMELSIQDISTDPDARSLGVERTSKSVLRWLSMVQHEWLIILDNADGDPYGLAEYVPPGNHGNILFTSRNQGVDRYTPRDAAVQVDNMDEDDAISLLLHAARLDGSPTELTEAARPIVKELYYFPLAIDQAGAAIQSGLCNIYDYPRIYSGQRRILLADPNFKGASNYGCAVYATWDVSYMAIKGMANEAGDAAIVILQMFAFFHHETIGEEIFQKAAEALGDPAFNNGTWDQIGQLEDNDRLHQLLQLDKADHWDPWFFRKGIQILLSFSLIKRGMNHGTYSVHPLVHCWCRDRLSPHQQQTNALCASALLSSSISLGSAANDYAFRRALIPHIKAISQYYAGLGVQIPYNQKLYIVFGFALNENGYWKEAEQLDIQVIESSKRILGEEHPDTLSSLASLSTTYWNQGRWKEAEQLDIQVMESCKRIFGEEHPDTLSSMANLAATYRNQGHWKEAKHLEVQVMERCKRILGEEHPDTLRSMASLAATCQNQGHWKEAEQLDVQVIESCKRTLGEEHPHTLSSLASLSTTYWNQGHWKEAEQLDIQVMKSRKKILGEEHPDTLSSMANLAATYRNNGHWKEAEQLEVQVMESRKRILGEEHPDTLRSMGNLAATYRNQGHWKEAEQLCVQVMESRKRILGEEHPDTLTSMANLAATYQNQGHWKEAEQLQVQVMESSKRILGEEHPDTLTSMANLAATYWNQGHWKEAEQLEVQVMESRKRILGEEHPDTLTSMANLAATYWKQGHWKEAEQLGAQVMESSKRILGEGHPDTLSSMASLSTTYWNHGYWKEAEQLDIQVMESRKRILGEEHPDTLRSMANLAATYRNQGHWKEAEQLEVQVMESHKRILGEEHPHTLSSMANLAAYENQGN